MATATSEQTVKGGAWLIGETDPATVMTPEKLNDEHKLIRQTAAEFIKGEVLPVVERLEKKEWALNRELLKKCGGLGLLGTNIPEEYGGVDLDKISTLIVSEQIAGQASFATTFGAQANLTILPIYMFGTEAQRQKYLPGLVSGEMAGAYCLSESGSGSDALGAKTQGDEAGRRQLPAVGREDVDQQRRLRRRLHRVREGRRRALHRLHRRTQVARRVERQGRAQARPARLVDDADHPAGREGARGRGARRDRQGPQGRVQRAELRPLQAGRDVLGRRQDQHRRSGEVRRLPQAVQHADRVVRRDQAQARRDDGARVRARKHDVSHRRPDRSAHCRDAGPKERRRRADAAGARGVRRRSVDRQGPRQRDRRLRDRREPADPRRQRLRARLSRRRPLPRCARQPHLRRHQRDQPPADPRHADEEGDEGRAAADAGGEGAAGRDHEPVDERGR